MEKLIIFNEANPKIMEIFSCGLASVSLAIAFYKTKPFTKFRKPSSIPIRFLQQKFQGTVARIEPGCDTILMVDHKPLIPLPRLSNTTYLPIKIANLDITTNGISWLNTVVNGKEITFIPLSIEKNYVTCIISIQQNKECIKIGEELTKLGFAMVTENSLKLPIKDKDILNYHTYLLKAQQWAQYKRNGHWHFLRNPTILWKIKQYFKIN